MDAKWAWKLQAPKAGQPQQKTFQSKEYIYCPHHETTKWVLKVNKKGLDHATNCEARGQAQGGSQQARDVALSGIMEDADANGNDEEEEVVVQSFG